MIHDFDWMEFQTQHRLRLAMAYDVIGVKVAVDEDEHLTITDGPWMRWDPENEVPVYIPFEWGGYHDRGGQGDA